MQMLSSKEKNINKIIKRIQLNFKMVSNVCKTIYIYVDFSG